MTNRTMTKRTMTKRNLAKMTRRTLGLLLALLLLSAQAQTTRGDLDAIRAEVAQLEQRFAEIMERLGTLEAELLTAEALDQDALWDEDGLFWQPRLARLQSARAYGFAPGSSMWEEAPLPPGFQAGRWNSPGALLLDLVGELGYHHALGDHTWELSSRVLVEGDSAQGAIMLWGFQDDAVAGEDLRVIMQEDAGGWFLLALERRYHCWRGVADGLCL